MTVQVNQTQATSLMSMHLESLRHEDTTSHVVADVVHDSGLRAALHCTSPSVLTALAALKEACCAELSDGVGRSMGASVTLKSDELAEAAAIAALAAEAIEPIAEKP